MIALSALCVSVSRLSTPVLLCESKFNKSVSLISSTVNPSGANLSIPSSLVCAPNSAIALAPCVVDPNRAAKFCELFATSSAKSSNGSAALAAAVLSSTIDCPKLAPVCESCLNVSMFTSNLFPNVCSPTTLSVKALIDPDPSKAALPRPTKLLPTFLNPSTTSS